MTRITALAAALLCALFSGAASAEYLFSGVRSEKVCIASEYGVGDGYHGRRTASGERFNTYALTAAMLPPHPLRSFVSVTNLANGRSVRVWINDRGPFVRGRCIDLSRAAANAIGMKGLARVSVSR